MIITITMINPSMTGRCGVIKEPYCKFSKSMIIPISNMIITIITMIRWHRGLPAGKKPLTNLKFSIPTTLGRVSSGWEAQALPGRRGDSIMFRIKYPITQQPYNTDTVTHHPQNTNAQQTYCIITQTQALHLFFFTNNALRRLLFQSKLLQQSTKLWCH